MQALAGCVTIIKHLDVHLVYMSSEGLIKLILGTKQSSKHDLLQFVAEWHAESTSTIDLERVTSWFFSWIIESIWWQTLIKNMQVLTDDPTVSKSVEMFLGSPSLHIQQQRKFSIILRDHAYQETLKRLCPVWLDMWWNNVLSA